MAIASTLGQIYGELGQPERLNDKKLTEKGVSILWNLLERYAPYLAYNREVAMSFGNPSLTYESSMIPYQYYRFVDLYKEFGGDEKKVETLVKPYGMSVADLKKRYEQVYGKGASSGSADLNVATVAASPDKIQAYAEEIAKYCEVANELAGLSPEEYAAREEDRGSSTPCFSRR